MHFDMLKFHIGDLVIEVMVYYAFLEYMVWLEYAVNLSTSSQVILIDIN